MTGISTVNGGETELSPEQEKEVIFSTLQEVQPQVKDGDVFFILSYRWWRTWSEYVNQNLANDESSVEPRGSGSSRTVQKPQSIDNSDLIRGSSSENSTFEIHEALVEGTDYILVPEKVWNQFYSWYGGGPALARKAITHSSPQIGLTVEVYPLRLLLHLMSTGDQHDIRISRRETVGALHSKARETFDLNSDQVSIWDYYGHQKHALLNDFEKTLDEANIRADQDILVEVINVGRSFTTIQVNGYSGNDQLTVVEPSRMNHSIAGGSTANNDFSGSHNSELLQFQSAAEKAPASFGVSTRGSCIGLIGLLNLGNTCFMNSAIQCLVHTPEFAKFFIEDFRPEINWQNPLGMQGELAMGFGALLRRLWAPGRAAVSPRDFKAKLARFAPQFGGHKQHDSQELLAFLLDGLHEDLNRVKHKPYIKSRDANGRPEMQVADEFWANHISRNDSIVVDVFQGQYKSTLTCPVCDQISVTFDPFMHLSLPLQSATPRTMTVTVFSCDGSVMPATCTVTLSTLGCCRDLVQALSSACFLKQNEKILLAEVHDHLIHRFLEDPLIPLSVIKDDTRLNAYRIPKLTKNPIYLQLVHRRENPPSSVGGTTTWKPFGTPFIFPISTDATIARGDIQLIAHTMLSPLLKQEKSQAIKSSIVSESPPATICEEAYSPASASFIKLPLKLVDENNDLIDISAEEEKNVCLSSSSVSVILYIDWSPELGKKYEMQYLQNLPEVFKNEQGMKKARIEPLSLYSCIEAFLREEPLVPEDMWFCPQCKERRQASKKFDLWRLPEVLVVHLKRFSYSRTMKSKLETFVNFPLHDFDLTKYVANKNNLCPQVYELYALTNHYGNMGSGHYTAHIKLIHENKWYNFDDNHVTPISEADVKSSAAYVLFYRRVKSDGAHSS